MDGLLLVGFGAPESVDDIWPFLERIAAGRDIPPQRLSRVAEHYRALGGSPLNAHNRDMLAAIGQRLEARGISVPIALGNRNAAPFIDEGLAELAAAGARDVLAFFATPWASYSGCRQYREDIAGISTSVRVRNLPPYSSLAGVVEAHVAVLREAQQRLGADDPTVLFSTHSLPIADALASGAGSNAYVTQQREVARHVAQRCGVKDWQLVYQSRSGHPGTPWLEPDISAVLDSLAAQRKKSVIVVPLGFLSDHMEVLWDLDRVALARAGDLGISCVRAATIGARTEFLDDLARHLGEVLIGAQLGTSMCSRSCCANQRGELPTCEGIS